MSARFCAVLLVSLVVKALLAFAVSDIAPQYDERQFLRFATDVYQGNGPPVLWRAPGYQLFMALGLALAGGESLGIRLLQVLASVASSLLVYRIARREWGEGAGLAAGAFVALYPAQVAFSHLLWSETLYCFLTLFAFERLLAADRRGSLAIALSAGLLLGAASLTRSTGLGLVAVSGVWLLFRGRTGVRPAAALLAGAALLVVPWSLHATARAGCPVLVDMNGGYNIWNGNNEYIPEGVQAVWGVGLRLENGMDPSLVEFLPDDQWRDEVAYRMASAGIASRFDCDGSAWYRDRGVAEVLSDPGEFLLRIPLKLSSLWSPDLFLTRHLVRDWYGETPVALALGLALLALAASVVPLVLGPAALAALSRTRLRSLALLWVLLYLAAHSVIFGVSRMHFPLVPLLVLLVAGVFLGDEAGARQRMWRRGAPWMVLVLAAWLLAAPVQGGLYLSPNPRHATVARMWASLRDLPLPGTRYLGWSLATVEGSRGDRTRADQILSGGKQADAAHPFSLYLRGRLALDEEDAAHWLARALEKDPELFAALVTLGRLELQRSRPEWDAGIEHMERALAVRPWDEGIRAELRTALRMRGRPALE